MCHTSDSIIGHCGLSVTPTDGHGTFATFGTLYVLLFANTVDVPHVLLATSLTECSKMLVSACGSCFLTSLTFDIFKGRLSARLSIRFFNRFLTKHYLLHMHAVTNHPYNHNAPW